MSRRMLVGCMREFAKSIRAMLKVGWVARCRCMELFQFALKNHGIRVGLDEIVIQLLDFQGCNGTKIGPDIHKCLPF